MKKLHGKFLNDVEVVEVDNGWVSGQEDKGVCVCCSGERVDDTLLLRNNSNKTGGNVMCRKRGKFVETVGHLLVDVRCWHRRNIIGGSIGWN